MYFRFSCNTEHGLNLNKYSRELELSKDHVSPGVATNNIRRKQVGVVRRTKSDSRSSLASVLSSGNRNSKGQTDKGDEGLSSGGTKLNSIFITAGVTFTKPK
ncbi:hypothetical protein Tco_1514466 [Tanacetum coccineum]